MNYAALLAQAEEAALGGALGESLAKIEYIYGVLTDVKVPQWANRERSGYAQVSDDQLPMYRRETLQHFDAQVTYQPSGYTAGNAVWAVPPQAIASDVRDYCWREPVAELQQLIVRTQSSSVSLDLRHQIPAVTRWFRDHPQLAPGVLWRVDSVSAALVPAKAVEIVETVRTRVLHWLLQLRPLLDLSAEQARSASVDVDGNDNVIIVQSVLAGERCHIFTAGQIEDLMRGMPASEPKKKEWLTLLAKEGVSAVLKHIFAAASSV